jgi:hypothetical protein
VVANNWLAWSGWLSARSTRYLSWAPGR